MKLTIAITKLILIKIIFATSFLLFASPASSAQQDVSDKVKAAYIFNFIKYIEWPNEKEITNFTIGYYGNEKSYYGALHEIQDLKVRHFNINVVNISSIAQIESVQIVVLDKEKSKNIKLFLKSFNKQTTLIVSDNAPEKRHTMINFIKTDGNKVKFELNRYQMLNAKLKVSPEILVLGGTEIDIANVLKEMSVTITKSLNEIEQQSDRLKQLKDNITAREKQLTLQQSKLSSQQEKIKLQNNKLTTQESRLKQNKIDTQSLQDNFNQVKQELDISRIQLTTNKNNLQSLKKDIQGRERAISQLENQISERKKLLKNLEVQQAVQKQELAQQSSVIQAQYIVLIITGVVSLAILVIVVILYNSKKTQHKINAKLQENVAALAEANHQLSNAKDQLVESEKMAALGSLVAGVAHEINTPIGVSVTATTHLADQIDAFEKEYNAGQLKKSSLEELLIDAKDLSGILTRNLRRASELINNFKQVAVDQSSEDRREFELLSYIEELSQSLRPQLKQKKHNININSNSKIELNNFPGVIAQIITNLIMNSVNHGFINKTHGEIFIKLALENNEVIIDYQDNGIGLSEQQREKVFEPFYTTARSTGGSGLGMSISYNLIASKLNGTISCLKATEGAHFRITFPQ